jgi:hypothetical protein
MNTKKKGFILASEAAYLLLSWALLLCILLQTFLAGLAVFADPIHWNDHSGFVKLFSFVPLLMIVLSFTGRLPKRLRWQSVSLFVLLYSQYVTGNIPWAGAIHPVTALVMFWLVFQTAVAAYRHMRRGVTD